MLLTENKDNKEKPLVKNFESPNEAIEFFKKQKGTSELALGESAESKQVLASKENGKVNYVNDNFRGAYFIRRSNKHFMLKMVKVLPQARRLIWYRVAPFIVKT
jgi:hypothetical protein